MEENEYNSKFIEVQTAYEALPFNEKLAFASCARKMGENHIATKIKWDGFLMCDERKAVNLGDGDYYVYVWKHAWGEPFYVGSGTGKRWVVKAPRNPRFYAHLDKGDAVVYKVVSGLDKEASLAYEAYVSVMLSAAGVELSNGDNNVYGKDKEVKGRRMAKCFGIPNEKEIQDTLIDLVMRNESRADGHITTAFLEEFGTSYFTDYYHLNN